ncbi:MAG: DEAD/DEAH box helicase family protein [Anaerolineaceae bacterium]|nr:DEAD/DEAH box helicase family protein [Anaerolineaceae bacterium]
MSVTPEERARRVIDEKLARAGWIIQDMNAIQSTAGIGVAIREFPTSSGPVDYALFVDQTPVGVIEAKRSEAGESLTSTETQSSRYANSKFLYITGEYEIRFAYEATDKRIRFTDYHDIHYRAREVFSFFQPETLRNLLRSSDTIRNHLKQFTPFDTSGFRKCQINAIENLDRLFAQNKPRMLVQMATGAGKTFTAITESYRLLTIGKMNRILFLVDTKSLGQQAEEEFLKYKPYDDARNFPEIFGVQRLKSNSISSDVQICISTIQRMYSILKGEELPEELEERPMDELIERGKRKIQVTYNPKYPPEFFDCIIVDECHRSIYNVWSQIFDYFDAFVVGLTATPDSRTFAFFHGNIASEYSREMAIIDGVNVDEDTFFIDTKITKNGALIMQQEMEVRNRLTREKRWKLLDEDVLYQPGDLDREIVNPSQIRAVIRCFHENLFTKLFPRRPIVPKTLIFAKSDSHADDIVNIVREEFGMGNAFCQKITYRADNPEETLRHFRNDYDPRIAVTVDMIATGTDVKAIECLIFMRDVRSRNYFEQMKGRGTRTIKKEDFEKLNPGVKETKDHFVIVDAVGVTKSKKSETRTLERKPSVSTEELLKRVALNSRDEDTLTTLASRLIRLNVKLSRSERTEFRQTVGASLDELAGALLNAFDEDVIAEKAREANPAAPITEDMLRAAQEKLIDEAVAPFQSPENRNYVEDVRRKHDQIIDNVNIDEVLFAGFDSEREEGAERVINSFQEFIEAHRDEIIALRILYDQQYKNRPMALEQLKKLYEKLRERSITVERLWDCYAIKRPDKVKRGTVAQLVDLISLIRFEMGASDTLTPFSSRVNYNFQQWTLRRNAGSVHFTKEQMDWLYLIRDHIAASLSITAEDLDLTPFDQKGGLGRFYEVFGERYEMLLNELNEELVG